MAVVYSFGESEVCGLGPDEGEQVEALLDDLESGSPCGVGEAFVLGFGSVPFALCGFEFVDLRGIFTELTDLLVGLQPCSLENLTGSEFCGLELPDYEVICDAEALSLGICANHSYNQTAVDVPVGYPVVEGDSVLWFVGAPEFGFDETCGSSCERMVGESLRGAMSGMGGMAVQNNRWLISQDILGLGQNLTVLLPAWNITIANLLLTEEVIQPGPPPGFEWLTQEIADRLANGEEVPIEEIEGFPTEWTDDPLGQAALPYMHIRPGSPLLENETFSFLDLEDHPWCTANFVFEHVDDPDRVAMGIAGHCFYDFDQTIYTLITEENPDPEEDTVKAIPFGNLTMTTGKWQSGIPSSYNGRDFGLIEVAPEYRDLIDPAISILNGPCGWRNTTASSHSSYQDWDPFQYYGHNDVYGFRGQPRTGVVYADSESHFYYYVLPGQGGGDSGSPLRFFTSDFVPAAGSLTGDAFVPPYGGPQEFLGSALSIYKALELLSSTDENVVSWMNPSDAGEWDLADSHLCLD